MYTEHIDYSKDFEIAVLGACMIEKTATARVYGILKPEQFYFSDTKNIASAIWEMFENGFMIDVITVADFMLRKMNLFYVNGTERKNFTGEKTDIPYTVTKFTNAVVSTANLEYHAHILREMFINRKIKNLTHGGIETQGNSGADIKKLYEELNALNENVQSDGWLKMDELMVSLYKHQDEMILNDGKGLQTGFKTLDNFNGGFFPGNVIVIGARPSVGKSALAAQIALNVARQNKKVGIISLEMNNNEISGRIASIDTNIDFGKIYRGLFDDERQRDNFYNRVNNTTSHLPIWISDKTDVKAIDIRAKAAVLKSKHGLDLLIIDYLQLISSPGSKNKTRENEVSEISRSCKIMAKELNIPVIELCQLNRAVTQRKGADRYPHLSDLRESGSIEQDADIILFLHSDWLSGHLQNEDGSTTEGEADLLIRKWRNGRLGHIRLNFIGSKMKFEEKPFGTFANYVPEEHNYNDTNPF